MRRINIFKITTLGQIVLNHLSKIGENNTVNDGVYSLFGLQNGILWTQSKTKQNLACIL